MVNLVCVVVALVCSVYDCGCYLGCGFVGGCFVVLVLISLCWCGVMVLVFVGWLVVWYYL